MKKEEILILYRYNAWANQRILGVAAKVTPEQFLVPAPFSHGSLRGTLVHTLSAEWIWRQRWEGHSPVKTLSIEDFPTFEALHSITTQGRIADAYSMPEITEKMVVRGRVRPHAQPFFRDFLGTLRCNDSRWLEEEKQMTTSRVFRHFLKENSVNHRITKRSPETGVRACARTPVSGYSFNFRDLMKLVLCLAN